MDELAAKLERISAELAHTLGDEKGEVGLDFQYDDEVTITGNRVGLARLALDAIRAAQPPPGTTSAEIPERDEGLLISPIADIVRTDLTPGAPTRMRWKDRLIAVACLAFALFALVAFFRGCAALQNDLQQWLRY